MTSFEEALAAARAADRAETRQMFREELQVLRAELASGALSPARRWLNTQEAAEYLGIHEDTLTKAAARGEVRSEQDKPGAKRWFEPEALDEWRRGGAHMRPAA